VVRHQLWSVLTLPIAAVVLAGCAATSTSTSVAKPGQVVQIDGTNRERVLLTEAASERLGIKLTPVRDMATTAGGVTGTSRRVIPQSAVFYDEKGATWTFVSKGNLAYEREPVTIASIDGDFIVLQSGPDTGTEVVSVGADELRGIEDGVGGD
jgi:hypothetical protein